MVQIILRNVVELKKNNNSQVEIENGAVSKFVYIGLCVYIYKNRDWNSNFVYILRVCINQEKL